MRGAARKGMGEMGGMESGEKEGFEMWGGAGGWDSGGDVEYPCRDNPPVRRRRYCLVDLGLRSWLLLLLLTLLVCLGNVWWVKGKVWRWK